MLNSILLKSRYEKNFKLFNALFEWKISILQNQKKENKRTVRIKILSKNLENWPWGYLWANLAGNCVIVSVLSLATFQRQKICRYV